jgi:hypothetical protein
MDTITLTPFTIVQRIDSARELQQQIDALTNRIDALEDPLHVRISRLMGNQPRYSGSSKFSVEGDLLHFTATFAWESDEERSCAIPLRFITEPDVEMAKSNYRVWVAEQERIAANRAMQAAGAEREAKERAEFERLRAKFETGVT